MGQSEWRDDHRITRTYRASHSVPTLCVWRHAQAQSFKPIQLQLTPCTMPAYLARRSRFRALPRNSDLKLHLLMALFIVPALLSGEELAVELRGKVITSQTAIRSGFSSGRKPSRFDLKASTHPRRNRHSERNQNRHWQT